MVETIISLATLQTYDINLKKGAENHGTCPECSHLRKSQNRKAQCFSYNAQKEVGHCMNCDASFVKHKPFEKKEYLKPVFQFENYTKLSDKMVKYFESRGISQRTLLQMKISEKKEWLPQTEKEVNCIVFPFFKENELINLKFRDGKKNFKLSSGAELIWYNYDAILNNEEIIICEGEMDALSFIQSGFDNVISVPNGANIGRMEYFDSSVDDLNKVKTFIIATDNDVKGVELKNDLIRRIGMEKCKTISFKHYKDANDVIVSEGIERLKLIISEAKLIPMPDVFTVDDFQNELDDYFENGMPQGKTVGNYELDKLVRWQTGRFGTVTGIPGMGKSEFVDFVYAKLNILYGWGLGYYSPESMPLPLHFSKIYPKFVGKEYKKGVITMAEKLTGEEYINKNVFWVNPEIDINIDEILARFEYLVKAKGCKAFVIDPFNRIEQTAKNSDDKTLLIKKNLSKMINFSKKTDSLLLLIAHPTKMRKEEGTKKYTMPTAYDVSGTADFYNMSDYCITVHRSQDDSGLKKPFGTIFIEKTKYNKTMGDTGLWSYWYNINNGRYITDAMDGMPKSNEWDNTNWITKEENKPEEIKPLPMATLGQAFELDEDGFAF